MKRLVSLILVLALALSLPLVLTKEPIPSVRLRCDRQLLEAAVRLEEAQRAGFTIHNGPPTSNEGQIQIMGHIRGSGRHLPLRRCRRGGLLAAGEGHQGHSWDSARRAQPEHRPSIAQNTAAGSGRSRQIGNEGQTRSFRRRHGQPEHLDQVHEEELKPEYEKIELVTIVYGDDLTDKSYQEMQGLINSYPDLKGVISPTTVGIAAAAVAIKDMGLSGKIKLTGLGLPSEMADHLKDGTCEGMYLWNPIDLGYVAAYASVAMVKGEITGAVGESFEAGRLGTKEIMEASDGGSFTLVGDPFRFTPENIDEWKDVY